MPQVKSRQDPKPASPPRGATQRSRTIHQKFLWSGGFDLEGGSDPARLAYGGGAKLADCLLLVLADGDFDVVTVGVSEEG